MFVVTVLLRHQLNFGPKGDPYCVNCSVREHCFSWLPFVVQWQEPRKFDREI